MVSQVLVEGKKRNNKKVPTNQAQASPSHERILEIHRNSTSLPNFATNLMLEYFSESELIDENVNVTGRRAKGVYTPINPLDNRRIEIIKQSVLNFAVDGVDDKKVLWRRCLQAMIKKMSMLKKYVRRN